MSRRTLSSAALAAVLLSSGLTPLLGTAHADNCVTWSDAVDDTSVSNLPPGGLGTNGPANLDVTRVSVQTVGDSVVATLKLKDLDEAGYSYAGDQFQVQMTLAGTPVSFLVRRGPTGSAAQVKGPATGAATSEVGTNTISIAATQAEVDKAAGKSTAGIEATNLAASTYAQVNNTEIASFDSAQAPNGTVFTVGAQCSPAIPATPPLKLPSVGCETIDDPTGDAKPKGGTTDLPGASNDPTLDIAGIAINTTPTKFIAFLHVPGLPAKAGYNGDEFAFGFNIKNKFDDVTSHVQFTVRRSMTAVRGESAAVTTSASDSRTSVSGKFDVANKFVVISVDRASFEEASIALSRTPANNGTTLTNVRATASALLAGGATSLHDVVDTGDAATRTYTIGVSPCFEPVVTKLTNLGPATVQFGDVLDVSAKLTSATDQPFANKPVKFTLGSVNVTANTDAEGVASAKLTPTASAGTHNLVISYAGDQDTKASTVTKQITVAPEVAALTLTVTKSGTKRTVSAKLLDDDGKALAGQVVTWFVNGKKISAPKTNSGGVVTISTAKAGQTVKADFAGVADKYAPANAQVKLT